jgi:Zn-dependent M16 (insulinase) family peptidase
VKGYFTLATEETSHDGLPHTLEHLIFLGSERYPYKGVLDLAANHCLAQGTNAWTAIDHTCYTVETAGAEGFLILLPIYLDHIFFPTLSDQAFKTEVHHINGRGDDAGVVYCEMQARENNAESREDHAIQEAVFLNDCGYKWETGGIMENLRTSCSNEKVRAYHRKFYRPENLDIIICGDISIDRILDAVLPVDDRAAATNYGVYERPWTGEVKLFDTYATTDVLFPAKNEDNGRLSITWKGPLLNDLEMGEAHSILWNYMISTSAAPLVKSLIDIPEPLCSSISHSTEDYPVTLVTVTFKGVKPEKHAEMREIVMQTLKETYQGSLDMIRLRNQIKNSIANFYDKLENDPSEILAELVISDALYGGEDHTILTTVVKIFETLESLRKNREPFWKNILQYYIEEANVTVNSIPSKKCMDDLEANEKDRVSEQQKSLGPEGLAKCEKEINDCIEFNEKNLDEVDDIIEELPLLTVGEGMSFHPLETNLSRVDQGIITHEIESDFVRFYFTFDTDHLSREEKALLGVYAKLFCDTSLLHGEKEISYEDAIKLKEKLLLDAKIFVSGAEIESLTELVLMLFKFSVEDLDQCKEFIKNIISNKIFTEDRVTTAVNKMISVISVKLRKAKNVLRSISAVTRFSGSCKSSRNLYTELSLLESFKTDIPALVKKLEKLQNDLFYGNKIILHITSGKKIFEEHFSDRELTYLQGLYHLSKANIPSRLPSSFKRLNYKPEQLLKVVSTDESSYLILTSFIEVSYNHPDYVPVALFSEYLGQLEGPLWKQIRGQGFAYSYSLYNSPASGSLVFYLGKATNVSKGYLAAKETIDNIVTENELEETQIETAKGALASGIIQKYETPSGSAITNIINIHRDLPLKHDTSTLTKIAQTEESELLDACKKYFQPIFSGNANLVVCCPTNKKDEIVGDLAALDLNVKIIDDVEKYFEFLNNVENESKME